MSIFGRKQQKPVARTSGYWLGYTDAQNGKPCNAWQYGLSQDEEEAYIWGYAAGQGAMAKYER